MNGIEIYKLILIGAGAFLLGSIPFSYIITKVFAHKDIRNIGSGNPGATNVVRALDIKYGIIVLILDIGKGAIAVYFSMKSPNPILVPLIGLAVVLGHDYTPFLRFKGGKGVATSLGVFLMIAPVPTLMVTLIFFIVTSIFKYVSFGSVMASISYPILAYLLGYTEYILLAVLLGGLIIYKHKDNLKRLWYGREKRSV